jgi:IclR family acetate operon transcriptional repressor
LKIISTMWNGGRMKTPLKTPAEGTGRVQAVERALALLESLAEEPEGRRLTELSALTGLSPSTAHRLLTTLQHRRFVQFDGAAGLWRVGRGAYSVGSTFAEQRNFVGPALPFLRRLRDQTRETANLGIVDDGEVVVLTQIESRQIMRAITRVGGRVPMAVSGMGKAILATYPREDVDTMVDRYGLRALTPRSIVDRQRLHAELDAIAERGYSVDDEEYATGLRCVAAVVRDHRREILCAISVSGLTVRMPRDDIPRLGKLVAQTATELGALVS